MASSIPQFRQYSDHQYCCTFFNQFCDFPTPLDARNSTPIGASTMCVFDEPGLPAVPFYVDTTATNMNAAALQEDFTVPPEPEVPSWSTFPTHATLPEQFMVADMTVPVLPEFDAVNGQSFDLEGIHHHHDDLGGFGDREYYCNGLLSDIGAGYPPAATSSTNWGYQVNIDDHDNRVASISAMEEEHGSMKVGKYSAEERKERIIRYLNKRHQRNFNKTIKYACRKTLADKRVRVRGRFARNNKEQYCKFDGGEATTQSTEDNNLADDDSDFYNDQTIMIKHDGEDWLQEFVGSLMHLPAYISAES